MTEKNQKDKAVKSEVIVLDNLKTSNLPELIGWKEKQEKLVEDNPYVEIIDTKTYNEACKSRTNLLKGRTELQNQDKAVASKLASFRKEVGTETATLIDITKPHEEKQDTEVKRWEDIKAKEKEEKANAEANRVKAIQDKLESIETEAYKIIQPMEFSEIEAKSESVKFIIAANEFDFEEFYIVHEQVISRVETALESKVKTLTANEEQRLDNLRLEKENAESKRISDLQAKRLTEIMPYVAFGVALDFTKLGEMDDTEYAGHLESKKGLFEADAIIKQEAFEIKLAKEKEEKEAVLIIRRNRLNEIGFDFAAFQGFNHRLYPTVKVNSEEVYHANTVEFESIFSKAKKEIEDIQIKKEIRANREKRYAEAGMPLGEDFTVLNFPTGPNECFTIEAYQIFDATEEQFENGLKLAKEAFFKHRAVPVLKLGYVHNPDEMLFEMDGFESYSDAFITDDFEIYNATLKAISDHVVEVNKKLAIADAAKLKAENKARIKQYAKDKKTLTEFVGSLDFRNAVPELENSDLDVVVSEFLEVVEKWKSEAIELISKY